MSEPLHQMKRGHSNSGCHSDRESMFRFHLACAGEAAKEAREDGSYESFSRCLAHAKVALSVAKKSNRPDLEQEAQLATIDILGIAGRRREATEARIIAAAMADDMELEFEPSTGTGESGVRLASVGGVPIDAVIQLLEEDNRQGQCPPTCDQKQPPATENTTGSDEVESAATSDPRKQQALPTVVLEGRQIRDIRGRLGTVLTSAPKLRRKPNFME